MYYAIQTPTLHLLSSLPSVSNSSGPFLHFLSIPTSLSPTTLFLMHHVQPNNSQHTVFTNLVSYAIQSPNFHPHISNTTLNIRSPWFKSYSDHRAVRHVGHIAAVPQVFPLHDILHSHMNNALILVNFLRWDKTQELLAS